MIDRVPRAVLLLLALTLGGRLRGDLVKQAN